MAAAALEPTPTRMLVCALIVLLVAAGVWKWIDWRSAPPPPPKIEMPGAGAR